MENYLEAHKCRAKDVNALLVDGTNQRGTIAIHLGGVSVECKLKSLILKYHNISKWEEKSKRNKDPKYNQSIKCTSHALKGALKSMDILYKKALADISFLAHLQNISHPNGATCTDFIDLRYSEKDIVGESLTRWQESYKYVIGWLEKNEALI